MDNLSSAYYLWDQQKNIEGSNRYCLGGVSKIQDKECLIDDIFGDFWSFLVIYAAL